MGVTIGLRKTQGNKLIEKKGEDKKKKKGGNIKKERRYKRISCQV